MPVSQRRDPLPPKSSRPTPLHRAFLIALLPLVATAACGPDAPIDELVRSGDVYLDPQTLEPYSGPYEAYFANRRVSAKETYRSGRRDGPYEWYFESGQLFEAGTYRDGVLDGPYEAYWENGALSEIGSYSDGRYDGPRAWYLDGTLIERVTYVDGELTGNYERYGEDGTLEVIGVLLRGEPCGLWFERGGAIEYTPCGVRAE